MGETKTQHEIISKFNGGTLFADGEIVPTEFEQRVDGLGLVVVRYATSMHFSASEFSAGVQFPPKLTILFDVDKTGVECIEVFNKLRDFLAVVVGRKISIQVVSLIPSRGYSFNLPTLYFSEQKVSYNEERYAMFPLGCNSVRNEFGLPEFPLISINTYFTAPDEIRTYFKKYVKYRTLENPEEQFLGYFRLLEKLTSEKESFVDEIKLDFLLDRTTNFVARYFGNRSAAKKLLQQIRRTNTSKLNTASCITKFMKELPVDLSDSWSLGKSDVEPICKLRNDLIHANEIEPDEKDIQISAKFIEVLLLIALFRAIGVQPQNMVLIVQRMHGYGWVMKRSEPIIMHALVPK